MIPPDETPKPTMLAKSKPRLTPNAKRLRVLLGIERQIRTLQQRLEVLEDRRVALRTPEFLNSEEYRGLL